MFRGTQVLSLDGKGRLSIPAKYRETLATRAAGTLILTADPNECLLLYPLPDWEPIEQRLDALSSFNSATRRIKRLIVGNATEVEMDGSGRIVLPAVLREFAAIEGEVMLVGQGKKFEIWNVERWKAEIGPALTSRDGEIPPELEGISL
jgi:MraZ protein